jgi:hypothetical protein
VQADIFNLQKSKSQKERRQMANAMVFVRWLPSAQQKWRTEPALLETSIGYSELIPIAKTTLRRRFAYR